MKYIFTILMGLFLVVTSGAQANTCENVTTGAGYVEMMVNNNQAPNALKLRDDYKQKVMNISKELGLTSFEITEEYLNIYTSESNIDEGLAKMRYAKTNLRIGFKFEPHNKIQELYNRFASENMHADLTLDTEVECE